MVWYFVGVHNYYNKIEHYMITWRYKDSLFMLKNISPLKEKFRISVRPCHLISSMFLTPSSGVTPSSAHNTDIIGNSACSFLSILSLDTGRVS